MLSQPPDKGQGIENWVLCGNVLAFARTHFARAERVGA